MLKLKRVKLEGHISIRRGESLFCLNRTRKHDWGLQNSIWTNHKTSGTMSCQQIRPKWSSLAFIRAMFGKNQTRHFSRNTSHSPSSTAWEVDDMGLFCSHRALHLTVTESIINTAVYQSLLETNVRPSVWQREIAAGQWSKALRQICSRNDWRKKR